jgi:hypothetical protein
VYHLVVGFHTSPAGEVHPGMNEGWNKKGMQGSTKQTMRSQIRRIKLSLCRFEIEIFIPFSLFLSISFL